MARLFNLLGQMQFLDATGNPAAIPPVALPVNVPEPIVVGTEAGAPVSPVKYSGVITILAGTSSLPVSIPSLTVATGAIATLTQQDNGNGLTSLWGVITADVLTINAGQDAPTGGWKVYYQMASL